MTSFRKYFNSAFFVILIITSCASIPSGIVEKKITSQQIVKQGDDKGFSISSGSFSFNNGTTITGKIVTDKNGKFDYMDGQLVFKNGDKFSGIFRANFVKGTFYSISDDITYLISDSILQAIGFGNKNDSGILGIDLTRGEALPNRLRFKIRFNSEFFGIEPVFFNFEGSYPSFNGNNPEYFMAVKYKNGHTFEGRGYLIGNNNVLFKYGIYDSLKDKIDVIIPGWALNQVSLNKCLEIYDLEKYITKAQIEMRAISFGRKIGMVENRKIPVGDILVFDIMKKVWVSGMSFEEYAGKLKYFLSGSEEGRSLISYTSQVNAYKNESQAYENELQAYKNELEAYNKKKTERISAYLARFPFLNKNRDSIHILDTRSHIIFPLSSGMILSKTYNEINNSKSNAYSVLQNQIYRESDRDYINKYASLNTLDLYVIGDSKQGLNVLTLVNYITIRDSIAKLHEIKVPVGTDLKINGQIVSDVFHEGKGWNPYSRVYEYYENEITEIATIPIYKVYEDKIELEDVLKDLNEPSSIPAKPISGDFLSAISNGFSSNFRAQYKCFFWPREDISIFYLPGGTLEVITDPPGAELIVDGEEQGKSPLKVNDLNVGFVNIIAWKDGFEEKIIRALIENNKMTQAIFVLKKDPRTNILVPIKGGSFRMGDTFGGGSPNEKPVFEVRLSDFFIGKYEVTFIEYDAFCKATGKEKINDQGWGRDSRPVIKVNWIDAVEYCNWRSKEEGFRPAYTISGNSVNCDWTANGYRLPTEAEWEYAARGGQASRGTKYSGSSDLDTIAVYAWKPSKMTQTVGTKEANELELYDMTGNVKEWCWDWYGDYSKGAKIDPRGPASGSQHVARGGSWTSYDTFCTVSYRESGNTGFYYNGFRLVRSQF
jgi:formylglycine-generating enzyme required for sulfatase activity